jgi:ABC-2 type transport system ATP-binding protein
VIEVESLTKTYDSEQVLRGVSFTIQPGQVTAYLGPNGAGKSTTVKIITGLLRATSGQVRVCGHDLEKEPLEAKRRLGYVPEQLGLYVTLSAEEYLSFVAQLYPVPREVARERIRQLLEMFELSSVSHRLIQTYSRGQRQKVLISAALLHDPEVLVLDEPLQGLDANACLVLRRIIAEFVERGKTVLFCSHVLEVVERLCHRVLLLNKGTIVADDTTENLLKSSATGELESVFRQLTRGDELEEGVSQFLKDLRKNSNQPARTGL